MTVSGATSRPSVALVIALMCLSACEPGNNAGAFKAAPPGAVAPELEAQGAAVANCAYALRFRDATARIYRVELMDQQRGVVFASGIRFSSFRCFTNAEGLVVNIVDRGDRLF